MLRISAVAPVLVATALIGSVFAQTQPIFNIGSKNGLHTEFAQNRETGHAVFYKVGESSAEKDWPAYQPGAFDSLVGRSTMQHDWTEVHPDVVPEPFHVQFKLAASPKGAFTLRLDAIFRYRRPAPPLYRVVINGKFAASYRLNPHPAPELWWPNGGDAQGNMQYFGYESLDMQLPASAFAIGLNTIALECLDGFGIYYDDLSLSNDAERDPPAIAEASIEPTVLYKNRPTGLVELATIRVRTTKRMGSTKLKAEVGTAAIESEISQSESGDIETTIEVPATDKPVPVAIYLAGIKDPIYHGTFTPRRKWQVYALPMEQADFGYNDLPARTLEWENRFIDRTLEIQQKYPSYSFTLDAAANLESYLSTRQDEKAKQLLGHLRTGKWGMNALYANFFTGLSTPEELFRMLEFSLGAARQYNLQIDSASQTDEPSLTWALPQILSDAGIKYFTNGSDPIRGAFNPIGHLNFHSPFYWEGPTGSKVLMWSGISYTAVGRHDLGRLESGFGASGNLFDLGLRIDSVAALFSLAIRAR